MSLDWGLLSSLRNALDVFVVPGLPRERDLRDFSLDLLRLLLADLDLDFLLDRLCDLDLFLGDLLLGDRDLLFTDRDLLLGDRDLFELIFGDLDL